MKQLRLLLLSLLATLSITANAIIQQGSCGDNVTFVLNDDGTLIISGTGAMKGYSSNSTPWYNNSNKIQKIVVNNGVTSIGDNAFFGCSNLTSVTIPNSVTSIGNQAFCSCETLISVTIPNSVISIGRTAFYGCSNLTSVTIPNSVTSIGDWAFWNCPSLTSFVVDENNPSYSSLENVLFNKDKTELIYCSRGKEGEYSIPNSVIKIGREAFQGCSSLTSVTIPNSVTSIGISAFERCPSLTSLIVDENNPSYSSLENVLFNKDKTELIYCTGGKEDEYSIPNSVTSIGDWAFYRCSGLTSVTIPNSVTSIGDHAFQECSSLTSVTIPNSVTSIGNMAFYGCSNLTSVNINSLEAWCKIKFNDNNSNPLRNNLYLNGELVTDLVIPNSVTSINDYAFQGCSSLTSVTIGSSVQNIGNYAFYWANLETVTCLAPTVPSTTFRTFNDSYIKNATLIVPEGSLQAYKTTYPWSEFGTFKTIKKDETINDNCSTYSHEVEEESKNISYTRNFSNTSWQSLYVPFSMSYNDWKDDFEVAYINNVNQYDDEEDGTIDRTVIEVIKMKEGKSIEPNTPYLIKAKTTGEKTIALEDATLYQTKENTFDVTSWFTRFNFIGTYHTISNMASNGYYAMSNGELKKATSDAVTLQPFRWYLSVTDRNGNPVTLNSKSMSIVFDDGETTGIESVNNEKSNSSIHTLTGISKGNDMKSLAPGIYIKNGKKFIVK